MTYTPTTEDVRRDYREGGLGDGSYMDQDEERTLNDAAFDRWYAEEIRKAKAQALEEAANDGEIQDNRPWVEWWLRNRAQQLKEQQ